MGKQPEDVHQLSSDKLSVPEIARYLLHSIDMHETHEDVFKNALITKVSESCGEDAGKNIQKVITHVEKAHHGAMRKGNTNMKYVIHPLRVALRYAYGFEHHQQDNLSSDQRKTRFLDGVKICLGHDIGEENKTFSFTDSDIHRDFGDTAISGMHAMTIQDGEESETYLNRLNGFASIKVYDRIDNLLDFVVLYTKDSLMMMGQKSVYQRISENLYETQYHLLTKERIQSNPFLKTSLEEVMAYTSHATKIEIPPINFSRRKVA